MAEPRRSGAFRDTLIVAALTVAGVVGLIVWDGGDTPAAGGQQVPQGSVPEGVAPLSVPAGPGVSTGGGTAAPTAVAAPAGGQTVAPGAATTNPAAYEAMVAAQDALIAALPVPAGATEVPFGGAGGRAWTIPGTDWEASRDAYVAVLQQQGFTVALERAVIEQGQVGELYTLTDPTGTVTLQLAVGTFDGQAGIEVTRR